MIKKYLFFLSLLCLSHFGIARRIHIFGDSHASFCFSNERTAIPRDEQSLFYYNNIPILFAIHWLGAKTMYSIGKNGLNAVNLKNFGIENNDVVVFVFGEIDARCHIGKQRDENNRELDEVIETLVINFLNTLNQNKLMFQKLHYVIMSIMPPTDNIYNVCLPYHGTLEDRVTITQKINKKLYELSNTYEFDFFDIYSLYATLTGELDITKSDKVVHVNSLYNDQIKKNVLDMLQDKYNLF